MRLPPPLSSFLCGLSLSVLLIDVVIGHSQHRNPVSYITFIEDPEIITPGKRIHSGSSFDLKFTLHKGEQQVKFVLEPNHQILPDDAKVEYLDQEGNVKRSERIVRHHIKVYRGTSWLRSELKDEWIHAGWASVLFTRDGEDPLFEGAFTLLHDAHHIQFRSTYRRTRHALDPYVGPEGKEGMVVFRDSDVVDRDLYNQGLVGRGVEERDDSAGIMCPADRLEFNVQPGHLVNRMIMEPELPKGRLWAGIGLEDLFQGGLKKRQNLEGNDGFTGGTGNSAGVNLRNTIGNTDGCPSTRLVALVGVATDCTYTADFEGDQEKARANIITQINSASNLFEKTFNITLGLSSLVISDASCPGTPPTTAKWNIPCSSANSSIENRLNLFSEWRGTRSNDSNALWTLMTTCETGSAVGLAWLGMLCQKDAIVQAGQFVSGANVIARTSTEWKVIAHEIAHTMGAVHDCTSSTCQGNTASASMCCPLSSSVCDAAGGYMMNPTTTDTISGFSPCTVGNICSAFKRKSVDMSCLTSNRDVSVITQNECGNGIVEPGEDCDCGGTEACGTNSCCEPTTCKFKASAVCDDANEDCCTGCQFASKDKVCRSSNGPCDPEERCTGRNATCPSDVVSGNGDSCGDGLQCASGQCTSRDLQCKTVMGQYRSNSTHSCYDTDCQLTCASPEFGPGTCFRMQQNFLDGTPCNGDGRCKAGVCSGSSTLGQVKSWINKNKNIVIGVSVGIGALVIFSILSCIWSCCRRRRARKAALKSPLRPPTGGYQPHDRAWQRQHDADSGVYPMPPPLSHAPHHPRSPPAYGNAGFSPGVRSDRYA
ncbi:Metallo-peptidase family M12-domain-containing protein [Tuber brumale]|nr:Metallo-peptidase family M12-domain-containing protein [Tuber brumale]